MISRGFELGDAGLEPAILFGVNDSTRCAQLPYKYAPYNRNPRPKTFGICVGNTTLMTACAVVSGQRASDGFTEERGSFTDENKAPSRFPPSAAGFPFAAIERAEPWGDGV